MKRDKNKHIDPVFKKFILPVGDSELREFITQKKVDMMKQTVDSIEFALNHDLPMVELFQFLDSEFVITLSDKDFLSNLEHIYSYYLSQEMYELCSQVIDLKNRIGNSLKINEKQKH